MNWQGKKVAFLGYGIDASDVESWLREQGAHITILDEKQDANAFQNLRDFDVLVRSPGVYRNRPEILEAEQAGVHVTSKMNIFFDVCPTKNSIGITGTKGKGTTSMLIYDMLKAAGRHVVVGGNIGKGVFEHLEKITPETWVVLELSSFQLMDLHASPHIAVTLMVTVDHLDWHKDLDEYVAAKGSMTKYQSSEDISIYNADYPASVRIGTASAGTKIAVRRSDWTSPVRLRGEHNKENFAAAAAAARAAGVSDDIIFAVAKNFTGLEHRLEEVGTANGVTYYDDSISTTPDTAIAAIGAFTEPLVLILGGSEKGADFTELGKKIAESPHVKGVVLVGVTAQKIHDAIGAAGAQCALKEGAATMEEIMEQVQTLVKPGYAVVLSPACASFGMFQNYKDRGDQFKAAVLRLADENKLH